MPVQQSVCLPILPPMDQDQLLGQIAAIGYPAVEIWARDENFGSLCQAVERHGLRLVSMIGHASLPDGLNNRANHDRIEKELKDSIDLAANTGVLGLICFSGNRLPDLSESQAIEATADGLRRIAPYAETKGVNLNIELLNSKIDHKGYQCDHTDWGLQVVGKVGSPRVKLLYDIYHMQIMEGDIIRTLETHIDTIGHIHTAGNPGRHDLGDQQELNYTGICRALAATSYTGYMGHEFRPKGDVIQALRQAFEICNAG
jgi:hydroxypyruvate isomerase